MKIDIPFYRLWSFWCSMYCLRFSQRTSLLWVPGPVREMGAPLVLQQFCSFDQPCKQWRGIKQNCISQWHCGNTKKMTANTTKWLKCIYIENKAAVTCWMTVQATKQTFTSTRTKRSSCIPHWCRWTEALLYASLLGCNPGTTCRWPSHKACQVKPPGSDKICSGCTGRSKGAYGNKKNCNSILKISTINASKLVFL